MKAFSVICLVLLLAVTVRSEEIKEEDGVLVLTQDNFQQAIDENEFILVEFYAPWCGHCKALAPNYAKAAQQLKDKDSPIKLAKVDATEQKELGTRFEIRGYPTLKFFKNGVPKDYSGGRQTNDIVNWVEANAGPSFTVHNTVEEVRAFIDSADVTVMGYFESNETPEATAFIAAADGGLDSIKFGLCTSKEVAEMMQVKQPSVIVYKKFDDGEAVFPGTNWTAPDILSFINSERIGLVTVFSDETAPILFGGDVKSHLLAFISSDDAKFEDYMTNLKNTAKKFRGKVLFVLIDAKKEDSSRIMEFFTLTESQLPAVRLIYLSDDMKRYHPETEEIVEDKLTEFVQNYLDGKLQPHMNSEEIPDDWDSKPVKVLVGKNFKDVALDKTKHVFVEFYAPWCGHCKQLAPIWDELGEHFKDDKDVVIAKMDSTKNEVEEVTIEGFPTLIFFSKDSNEQINYDGGRTLKELTKWVEDRIAGLPIEPTVPGEAEGYDMDDDDDPGMDDEMPEDDGGMDSTKDEL